MSWRGNIKHVIKKVLRQPHRVGLVLGGGGARGTAHIGVLKVLVENNIPIDIIAGTSSGAIFGSLLAGGMSPASMEHEALTTDWLKLIRFKLSLTGPVYGEGIEKLITGNIKYRNIEELNIPMAVVATDLETGEKVVIKKGNIARAVHASSAIPGVFSPVEFEGRLLVDGLVCDNVPVMVAREMGADFVIAVDVIPHVTIKNWSPNAIQVIERSIDISCRNFSAPEKRAADVVIEPVDKNISAFSLNESKTLIEMGAEAARAALPGIKKSLSL